MESISRNELRELSESILRERILVPLFRAMDYRDVELYHWGPMEQGKDIVMNKIGDLGVPEYFGVVAKTGDISGQASGSSSGGEVATQIRQCFNGELSHPRTGESQSVQKCLVITTGRISKEARQTICNSIEDWQARYTRFVDGDELWELIQDHLGPRSVPARLTELGTILEDVHPDYRVISQLRGERVQYGIEQKEGVEDPAPLQGRIVLNTSDDRLKREAAERLAKHQRTGSSITLSSEHIESFELPDPVAEIFGNLDNGEYEIELGPRQSAKKVISRLEIGSEDHTQAELSPVVFRAVRVGTEEMTLTNEDQDVPWNITLVVPLESGKCDFQISMNAEGSLITSTLKVARFVQVIADGGYLSIQTIEASAELATFEVPPGQFPVPVEDEWIEFLEKARMIQEATGVTLRIPEDGLTEEDIESVYRAAHIIDKGMETLEGVESVTISLKPEGVQNALDSLCGDRSQLYLKGRHKVGVLGREIDFGPKEIRWSSPPLPGEERERLRERVEEASDEEEIPVTIPIDERSNPTITYLQWFD